MHAVVGQRKFLGDSPKIHPRVSLTDPYNDRIAPQGGVYLSEGIDSLATVATAATIVIAATVTTAANQLARD